MHLDIAPFAHQFVDGESTIFRWEESRDIQRIELDYPEDSVPLSVKVEYWQDKWPQNRPRVEDLEPGRSGQAAWKGIDDWFNGRWIEADMLSERDGNVLVSTFGPLAGEMPDVENFDVSFRRTIQIRIDTKYVMSIRIFTNTPVEERKIRIELGCGMTDAPDPDGIVEIYNGTIVDFSEFKSRRAKIRAMCSRTDVFSNDTTVLTVRSTLASFSFRPDDLENGPIWVPDLGALVSKMEDDISFHNLGEFPKKSVYDMVPGEPEQTLERALREQPPKRPMHFIVGIEGRRQKFGIEPNGDVFAGLGLVQRVPGPDTKKLYWNARRVYVRFHWDQMTPNGRFLEGGYLPIHRAKFSRGSLDITQEVFATRIVGDIRTDPIGGEDPVMAMVRLDFHNTGEDEIRVCQRISTDCIDPHSDEHLRLVGNMAFADPDQKALRMNIDTGGLGKLSSDDSELIYTLKLQGRESHSIIIKMPFLDLLTPEEITELQGKNWDEEHEKVRSYWVDRVGEGTQIFTGVQDIDDFHRALATHILINDDHEVGSNRIIGRVSSFNYGNFSNEAIMQILELDRRGYHEEAERHLETYLHYQGTVPLPGNFKGKEGLFYGSGGYEHGEYNQHHGWVLWGLAEHYRYTRDEGWLKKIAGGLVAGCDWVIRERSGTMLEDSMGNRCLEYGYLPAGTLEDVREFCYWLSTNALTYRGLAAAGDALSEIGHPDAQRIVEDAREYRENLINGIRESMIRSPVARLRDGTYIPHVPSRLYWRGRDVGWIREVLEGSIIAVGSVLDPDDRISTWIIRDFEDNRYIDLPFNYALDNFESQWFSRGGFSMQPNLIYGLSPYLDRDQVEHYLRVFFNGFAACWREEIRSMTEHPLPTLADWTGDHFKSSDESMVSYSLRSMFVHEEGNDLFMGKGIPRRWLEPGSRVGIIRACTYFGPVSFTIEVADSRRMRVEIELPEVRMPRRVLVRLRHPDCRKISKVEGGPVEIGRGGETFELLSTGRKLELNVHFESE